MAAAAVAATEPERNLRRDATGPDARFFSSSSNMILRQEKLRAFRIGSYRGCPLTEKDEGTTKAVIAPVERRITLPCGCAAPQPV
ncbi:MAG: hypothetical protein KIT18_16375, partial [Burkholderiales bacterium]|nr:hypothetical protein [Burkholderiales bacterium]